MTQMTEEPIVCGPCREAQTNHYKPCPHWRIVEALTSAQARILKLESAMYESIVSSYCTWEFIDSKEVIHCEDREILFSMVTQPGLKDALSIERQTSTIDERDDGEKE